LRKSEHRRLNNRRRKDMCSRGDARRVKRESRSTGDFRRNNGGKRRSSGAKVRSLGAALSQMKPGDWEP